MTTTEIALLSSVIGASSGIISQFIANILNRKTDKQKVIFELISEERKLARLILLNQKGYVQTGLTIDYYYQLAVINHDTKYGEADLQRHHDEIKYSNTIHFEYCGLIGEYCKNIYKLILYLGHSAELEGLLSKIVDNTHKDATGIFEEIKTYPKLYKEYSNEQKLVPLKLETLKTHFEEMNKIIQRIGPKKSYASL